MKTSTPKDVSEQLNVTENMLAEIADHQAELIKLNENLFAISSNSCSEYGDRKLQNLQTRLIWFQKVLNNSETVLGKHKVLLSDVIAGKAVNNKKNLDEYHNFCKETAETINGKIEKFKTELDTTVSRYC